MIRSKWPTLEEIKLAYEMNDKIKKAYETIEDAEDVIQTKRQIIKKMEAIIWQKCWGYVETRESRKEGWVPVFYRKVSKDWPKSPINIKNKIEQLLFIRYIKFDQLEVMELVWSTFCEPVICIEKLPDWILFEWNNQFGKYNFIQKKGVQIIENPDLYIWNQNLKSCEIEIRFISEEAGGKSFKKTLNYLDYR